MSETVRFWEMRTPVGPLLLSGDAEGLRGIAFARGGRAAEPDPEWQRSRAPFERAIHELEAYFEGERTQFDVPLALHGTPFQLEVWSVLRTIPYGETTSYGAIARRIGKPDASRAVGAANGRNPIPIIVPCHRVVGSDGALTGFGGGLPVKQALLELEARRAQPTLPLRPAPSRRRSDAPPGR